MSGLATKRPVVILAWAYPPSSLAGAARPARFAKYLEKLGHPVTVVCADRAAGTSRDGNVWRVHSNHSDAPNDSWDFLIERIFRAFVLPDDGFTWTFRIARLADELIRKMDRRPVILSSSPPVHCHMAALWLKRRNRCPWVADFRDPLVGNPFHVKWVTRFSDRVLQDLVFRNADLLISNTKTVAAMWAADPRTPAAAKARIHTIHNGYDPDEPLDRPEAPAGGKERIRHIGAIYGDREPGPILKSLRRLLEAGRLNPAQAQWELLGPADPTSFRDRDTLQWLVEKGVMTVHAGSLPKAEADRLLRESSRLVLLDVWTRDVGLQVPSKIFGYVRLGLPVLALTIPGAPVDEILAGSGIANERLYASLPDEEFDTRVMRFLSTDAAPRESSTWFQDQFDGSRQASFLSSLIEQLPEA